MALSATGFLFLFFIRPTSRLIRQERSSSSSFNLAKPGAGSIRMTANGPSKGRSPTANDIRPFRKEQWSSLGMRHVAVKDETDSRNSNIDWRFNLRTSAEKEQPTDSGGDDVL